MKQNAGIEIETRCFAALSAVQWTDDELLLVVISLDRIFYKFKL